MQAALEFGGEGLIHSSLYLNTCLALELLRNNSHCEMGLAFRRRTGMTSMLAAIVNDVQLAWCKCLIQL